MGAEVPGRVVLDTTGEPTRQQLDTIDRLAGRHDRVDVYPIVGTLDVDVDCLDAGKGRGLRLAARYTIAPDGHQRPRRPS